LFFNIISILYNVFPFKYTVWTMGCAKSSKSRAYKSIIYRKIRKYFSLSYKEWAVIDGETNLPGKVITFKGKDYEIVKILGAGTEGYVYLVKRQNKLFSLKRFTFLKNMQENIKFLNNTKEKYAHSLTVIDNEEETRMFICNYIRSAPLNLIFDKTIHKKFGISQRLANTIRNHLSDIEKKLGENINPSNAVWDIDKGKIYIIDRSNW